MTDPAREAAEKLSAELKIVAWPVNVLTVEEIAEPIIREAIDAEREACAEIARSWGMDHAACEMESRE